MSGTIQSSYTENQTTTYTENQTTTWLRGLVALAWADGHLDKEEEDIIAALLHQELSEEQRTKALEPISDEELGSVLGQDARLAENFLRTAVMVALADGDYSHKEDQLLQRYCQVLNQRPEALQILRSTLQNLAIAQPGAEDNHFISAAIAPLPSPDHPDVLHPVREWLDSMEVHDPKVAKMLCKLIPSQCPFERDITLFGRKLVHIPPLCKLNPLYEQLVGLRFRALSYLADDCGEDVSDLV